MNLNRTRVHPGPLLLALGAGVVAPLLLFTALAILAMHGEGFGWDRSIIQMLYVGETPWPGSSPSGGSSTGGAPPGGRESTAPRAVRPPQPVTHADTRDEIFPLNAPCTSNDCVPNLYALFCAKS